MFDCWGFDISTPRRCAFYCYWYFLRVVSHKKCQIYFLTLQYFRNHLSLIAKYERMDIFRMLRPAHYLLHKNYFIDVWSFVLFNLLLDMKSHMYFRNVQNSNGQNIIGHYLSIKSIIIHFSLGMLHVQEIGFIFFYLSFNKYTYKRNFSTCFLCPRGFSVCVGVFPRRANGVITSRCFSTSCDVFFNVIFFTKNYLSFVNDICLKIY